MRRKDPDTKSSFSLRKPFADTDSWHLALPHSFPLLNHVLESEFCLITTLSEVEFGKKQGRKRLWFLSQLIHENRIHSFNTIVPLSAQFPSFEKKRRPEITEDFRASYIFRMRDSSFHACLGKQHSGLLHRRNGIGHTACAHKECADDTRNDAVEHKGHKGLLQHLALTS